MKNYNVLGKIFLGAAAALLATSLFGAGTVLAAAPVAMTLNESHGSTSATLTGYFNGNGAAFTQTEFVWGTNSFGLLGQNHTNFTTQYNTDGSPKSFGNFSVTIYDLTPNTKYYFQAASKSNTGETAYGSILNFTTDTGGGMTCAPTLSADIYTVARGASTTLRFDTTGCGYPKLTSSNGTYSNTSVSGSSVTSGAIWDTTTFTLKAIDLAGNTISASPITIYVSGGSTDCRIDSFGPNGITLDYGDSTLLYWHTSTGCHSFSISPNIGSIAYDDIDGTISTGGLTRTTTYTLRAYGAPGSNAQTAQTTIYVDDNSNWNDPWNNTDTCTISSFDVSQTSVVSGGTATLSWTTYGCSSVVISGLPQTAGYLAPTGSVSTGPMYFTTTYRIYGYGSTGNAVGGVRTVHVSGNNQPYYPPTPTPIPTNGSVITTIATNIGSRTARLNGLIDSANPINAYFEYGTNPSFLNNATPVQPVSGANMNYYANVSLSPLTTYYYRAVATTTSGERVQGNVVSFTTASVNSTQVTFVDSGTTTRTTSGTGGSTTGGVTLSIKNNDDKVHIGDTAEFTINYANGSNKQLSNVILTVLFPQGFTAKQLSQGRMISPNNIEVNIGTLAPGQSGSVFLQATVDQNTPINQTLVTTATLNYTVPGGARDSTVAYVINHAGTASSLGGFALGAGFFPTTIFGWLITVLIILALVLIARRTVRGKAAHGGHAAHH